MGRSIGIRMALAAACLVCAAAPPAPCPCPSACPAPCPCPKTRAAVPGGVFVLSGPSGAGKSSLARRLVGQVPGLAFAVSHTTRPPRPGERDGVDYFFVDRAAFDAIRARDGFLECVETYGHRYGLSRKWLRQRLAAGEDVIMDLDTTGARAVRKAMPGAVTALVLPPSAQELGRRLSSRGTESPAQLAQRLGQARRELARYPEYDYLVVNDELDRAAREVEAVILAARARQERRRATARRILETFR
ncbi:MAG: guanylate kinase [Holophaga sp.]